MSRMYYHASPTHCIETLEPRVSNHGVPRVYLSKKRENVLVYLSNAVEKYCRETGFSHTGPWPKWGSYGFEDGKLCLDEYYPNALEDTYLGVSGYVYCIETVPGGKDYEDIPDVVVTGEPVPVTGCEFVPEALEAILTAEEEGLIIIRRYADLPETMLEWISRSIKQEYADSGALPAYRHFLQGKFPQILSDVGRNA